MHACVRLLAYWVSERIHASFSLLNPMLDVIKGRLMALMVAPSNSITAVCFHSPTFTTSFFPRYNPITQTSCQAATRTEKDPLPLRATPHHLQFHAATSGLWSKTKKTS
jgi:hypothetical protein